MPTIEERVAKLERKMHISELTEEDVKGFEEIRNLINNALKAFSLFENDISIHKDSNSKPYNEELQYMLKKVNSRGSTVCTVRNDLIYMRNQMSTAIREIKEGY